LVSQLQKILIAKKVLWIKRIMHSRLSGKIIQVSDPINESILSLDAPATCRKGKTTTPF
jgi:hypothetical protein